VVSSPTSLKLTILQLFEFSVHFLKLFLFFLDDWIFSNSFLFFLGSDLIKLVKIFSLNSRLLFNFPHFLVHDNIFWPLRGILMIEHLEFIDVGHLKIFGFRLPNRSMVVDIKLSFDSLISRKLESKVLFLEMKDH